ncbi:uncharacterized protein IL334_000360 [Kwoniella shivajii]|uniref:Uncharacterized protein n=1 Tax=Kwoniella shivajii TaxID=564305 RepID=A0ABZ1CQG6_9TREE|nr:hypothetical protein IL334_000360 [Kwoniella shivajii]
MSQAHHRNDVQSSLVPEDAQPSLISEISENRLSTITNEADQSWLNEADIYKALSCPSAGGGEHGSHLTRRPHFASDTTTIQSCHDGNRRLTRLVNDGNTIRFRLACTFTHSEDPPKNTGSRACDFSRTTIQPDILASKAESQSPKQTQSGQIEHSLISIPYRVSETTIPDQGRLEIKASPKRWIVERDRALLQPIDNIELGRYHPLVKNCLDTWVPDASLEGKAYKLVNIEKQGTGEPSRYEFSFIKSDLSEDQDHDTCDLPLIPHSINGVKQSTKLSINQLRELEENYSRNVYYN